LVMEQINDLPVSDAEMPLILEEVPAELPVVDAVPLAEPEEQAPANDVLPPTPIVEEVQEVPAVPKNTEVWRAQLLSSSDKGKVESSWQTILKQQAALLSDMPYQIVSATIAGKGTFWRLQVGEFSTKEMATNLCAKLKKKKQDCIPVK